MRTSISVLLFLINFLFSCSNGKSDGLKDVEDSRELAIYDSLYNLIKQPEFSKDSTTVTIGKLKNDSLKSELLFEYYYYYYKEGDSLNFSYWNRKGVELAIELNDTSGLANSYWALGNFYYRSNVNDSSYYYYSKAHNLYEAVQDDFLAGKMLLNMALIQKNIKDYSGSEVTTIKAIERIKPLGRDKQLYTAYNNLGIVHNELSNYDQSIGYHQQALKYAEKLGDPILISSTLNNVGVVLHNQGEYASAIDNYNAALSVDSIFYKNTKLYAMLKDNIANARLQLKDSTNIEALFLEALHIRDSIDHVTGIIINKIHLSDYYLSIEDTLKAMEYAIQANELASEYRSFGDLLESMLLLAKTDPSNSEEHLTRYINLNDSLQQRERAVRNKFARIRFETDEFIAENEYLMAQRKWMIGGSAGAMFILGLLIVIGRQKARHKELLYEKEQQNANEEIYNLLLDQKDKMEEVKKTEKERISRELHDGVLGTMYGIRFRLSDLNTRYDEDSIEIKNNLLEQLRLTEEEIRSFSHRLQENEILKETGFLQLLELLLEQQKDVINFEPSLKCKTDIPWSRIENRVKMNLYRIIQEAVRNTHKYAKATYLSIEFDMEGLQLRLSIRDNGRGFDVEKNSRGIGIKNMKSRVKDLEGDFNIVSGTGGTGIEIIIPIKNEIEDENFNDRRSPFNSGGL